MRSVTKKSNAFNISLLSFAVVISSVLLTPMAKAGCLSEINACVQACARAKQPCGHLCAAGPLATYGEDTCSRPDPEQSSCFDLNEQIQNLNKRQRNKFLQAELQARETIYKKNCQEQNN